MRWTGIVAGDRTVRGGGDTERRHRLRVKHVGRVVRGRRHLAIGHLVGGTVVGPVERTAEHGARCDTGQQTGRRNRGLCHLPGRQCLARRRFAVAGAGQLLGIGHQYRCHPGRARRLRRRRLRGWADRDTGHDRRAGTGRGVGDLRVRLRERPGARIRYRPTRRSRAARQHRRPPRDRGRPARCRATSCTRPTPHGDGSWQAGSGAIFDLRSNALRAAGLDLGRRRRAADPGRAGALRRGRGRPDRPRDPVHRADDPQHLRLAGAARSVDRPTTRRCRRWGAAAAEGDCGHLRAAQPGPGGAARR